MAISPYFKLTTHFHHIALGGQNWKHQIEAVQVSFEDTSPDDSGLADLADGLALFYQELCVTSTFIEKIVISTWFQDTDGDEIVDPGYDANESSTRYYSIYGTRGVGTGAAALDIVLDIRKSVSLGNPGRMPIRGCVLNSDFATNSQGRRGLLPGSPVANGGPLWTEALAHISPWLLGGGEPFNLSMLGEKAEVDGITPETVRLVTGITPVSVRVIQLEKHR